MAFDGFCFRSTQANHGIFHLRPALLTGLETTSNVIGKTSALVIEVQ